MQTVLRMVMVASLLCVSGCLATHETASGTPPETVAVGDAEEQGGNEAWAYAQRREAAIALARTSDDFITARERLAAVMAEPLFQQVSASEQRDVLSAAAWVEVRSGQYQPAARYYRRAVQLDPGDPDDWHRLSMAENVVGNQDAALDALLYLVQEWPHLVDALSAGQVLAMSGTTQTDPAKRMRLMQTLFDANWKREEEAASSLWYDLALALIEHGDREQAKEVIRHVSWPYPLMSMQADRRFDGLLPTEPGYVVVSLNRLIERLEALAGDNPRNLYTQNAWMEALMHAGRHEEVIAISGDILARIAAETPQQPAFHDSDDENFTMEIRYRALDRAGRIEEAEGALERASELTEFGEPNIRQKLALAAWYNGMLRPDEAIAAIDRLSAMAEAPDLLLRDEQLLIAALIKGERDQADELLMRIREKAGDDDSRLLTRALLRSGRMDEAEEVLVRRLQDPRLRRDALLFAQVSPEPEPLPGSVDYRRDWKALLARPAVKRAIDKVGRVQPYEVW